MLLFEGLILFPNVILSEAKDLLFDLPKEKQILRLRLRTTTLAEPYPQTRNLTSEI